jgi:hypothetical protein
MTTDTKKFIVVSQHYNFKYAVILSEWRYWTVDETYEELKVWCESRSCVLRGMAIDIPSEQLLTEFILRWS